MMATHPKALEPIPLSPPRSLLNNFNFARTGCEPQLRAQGMLRITGPIQSNSFAILENRISASGGHTEEQLGRVFIAGSVFDVKRDFVQGLVRKNRFSGGEDEGRLING